MAVDKQVRIFLYAIYILLKKNIEKDNMDNKTLTALILKNAQTITQLRKNIKDTFLKREKDPQTWHTACRIFHKSFDALAFPGGLEHGLSLLKKMIPLLLR